MKVFAFALLLVSSACALPSQDSVIQSQNERFVDAIVIDLVQSIINRIQELGLDPVNIHSWSGSYQLPVTNLFEAQAAVSDVKSNGLSNIVLNEVSYSILSSRLIVSLSLPRVESSVGSAEGSARLMGISVSGAASGSLVLSDLRVRADVTAGFGIVSGIFVQSVDVEVGLGGIKSDLRVSINDNDYSDAINNFLGNTLPNALAENVDEINELLEYIITRILENLRVGF